MGFVKKARSSMNAKIALIVTLPLAAILPFFSYQHYTYHREMMLHDAEAQIVRVAEGLKGPVETFIQRFDLAGLQDIAHHVQKGSGIELIAVYDHAEKTLASNKEKWRWRSMIDMHPEDLTERDVAAVRRALAGEKSVYYDPDDDQYCLAVPLDYPDGKRGSLLLSMDMAVMKADLLGAVVETAVLFVLLPALMGIVIYFLFNYHVTRRIRAVSGAAVRIADGDMKARADVTGTDEIGRLAASFNQLADEITNWRDNLEKAVVNRVKELQALYEVAYTISQSLDLGTVLPKVLDNVLETVGGQKGVIVLAGGDGETLKLMGQRGLSPEAMSRIVRTAGGDRCMGGVMRKNVSIRASDEEELKEKMPGMESEGMRSALAVPINARGAAFGAIAIYSDRTDRFSEQDEALLTTIGSQVGVAVDNAMLYEKTLELAQEDPLTGLANRRHFMAAVSREVARACRYNTPLSMLMLDLDRFKQFNDSYGHLRGDELLKAFAAVLRKKIRSTDVPGRYGGEEFGVVLPNTPLKGAIVIAERIRRAVENLNIAPEGGDSFIGTTTSIGVAEFAMGETDEDLIRAADAALYRAKQGGRNKVAW